MNEGWWAAAGLFITNVITVIVSALKSRQEARQTEAEFILGQYRRMGAELQDKIKLLQEDIDGLRDQTLELGRENANLRARISVLEVQHEDCKRENEILRNRLTQTEQQRRVDDGRGKSSVN